MWSLYMSTFLGKVLPVAYNPSNVMTTYYLRQQNTEAYLSVKFSIKKSQILKTHWNHRWMEGRRSFWG